MILPESSGSLIEMLLKTLIEMLTTDLPRLLMDLAITEINSCATAPGTIACLNQLMTYYRTFE